MPERLQCLGKPVRLAPSEVELGRKVQLLDDELSIYLVAHLKHCLFCLFAKHGFACYLEENDLEKYLEQPADCHFGFCKTVLACPHTTLWYRG